MSKEVIEDYIYELEESDVDSFGDLVTTILYDIGTEDTYLAQVLQIDLEDLDDIISGNAELTAKEFKAYRNRLIAFLKKEKRHYERVYYKDKA